ncbi:protein AKNAD1 [Choloepus didactylus]|uniref:protein AKNAD1 n=1 Tax=Choloepus didactylus TaxID=27675 RepID=UPI00189F96CB|nr:protein AKNAD1 [Choloepus didactylus]
MDEADFSEDTSFKQQEDLTYNGHLPQIKISRDYNSTSKNDILVSDQIILTGGNTQEKATHSETFKNVDMTMTVEKTTENAVNKKHDKENQCTGILQLPTKKEDASRSNISVILLNHLSKEEFLNGQGIDCETLPEISNVDSFDEAITKNVSSHYIQNSWPKEKTSELTDQLNPQSDRENSNKLSCSPIMTEKSTSDLEEPVVAGDNLQENFNFLTKVKGPRDKQKRVQGQAPQKRQTERASLGNGFKYGQGQVHYRLPDFSKIAPKVKIPKNNMINKPLTMAKQTRSSNLRGKSALVQDILATTPTSNCTEEQHQKQRKETTETSEQIQMEPTIHIHQELRGIESETRLLELSSTSQEDHSSSSSYIFQKIAQGQQMCQKLKEQTDQLKTKVQEFSKRIAQDSLHFQDRSLVLEKLQGNLELLEQEFLATKEKHLTLQQQDHKHKSPAVSDFDPERKVEGEIFKLEMLLEDVKEKIDESKYPTVLSPVGSPINLDVLASISSPPSNEILKEHPGSPSGSPGTCGSEEIGVSSAGTKENPSFQELQELDQQTYLNLPSVDTQDQPDPMSRRLSSDSREDAINCSGRQEHAETTVPWPSCAFCHHVLEWKQKMEKKGQRRINCGKFLVIIQEKALHPNLSHSSDAEDSFNSNSSTGMQSNKCEDCGTKIHSSRRVSSKDLPKEFHYRYNTPGQNYWPLDENKDSLPSCSKPKRICCQRTNMKTSQDEYEPTLEKKNLKALRTYSSDFATLSPHFHSYRTSGSKSLCDFKSINKMESEILNSALDTALRTATVLKETTDQMIKAIAEDLAKAQKWRNQQKNELFCPRKPMN